MAAKNRGRPVELLGDDDTREPVRQRERGQRPAVLGGLDARGGPVRPRRRRAARAPGRPPSSPRSGAQAPASSTPRPVRPGRRRARRRGTAASRRLPSSSMPRPAGTPLRAFRGRDLVELERKLRRHPARVLAVSVPLPSGAAVTDRDQVDAHERTRSGATVQGWYTRPIPAAVGPSRQGAGSRRLQVHLRWMAPGAITRSGRLT